uniref:Putative bovine pancreatic trypsin inhibitor n=1 Tax=Rhipicephalus microplus TaxID=6941 RepID=A0A6G5A7X9_RHIMP
MLKCSFVVILILCNIVPLNAGLKFWNIFSWGKRTTTTTTAPRRWPWYNYTFIKPSCNGGKGIYITCLYPDMCNCSKPTDGGYIRTAPGQRRWFYNNKTKKCERIIGIPGGCNNFDDRWRCKYNCELPMKTRVWRITSEWV